MEIAKIIHNAANFIVFIYIFDMLFSKMHKTLDTEKNPIKKPLTKEAFKFLGFQCVGKPPSADVKRLIEIITLT